MSSSHTPLDPSQLGADAQRALASPATRLMAARGLAPVANPRDLVSVLYQLAQDGDEKIRTVASSSASGLPERVLRAALGDAGVDPRVLDFFAERLAEVPDLVEVIVLNPTTADATVATLAGKAAEAQVDLIAQNEQRLLRCPDIIAAMYLNRRARMSTVDRVVELAVRNQVRVSGIPTWDELCKVFGNAREEVGAAVAETGAIVEVDPAVVDATFAKVAARPAADPNATPNEHEGKELWALPVPTKIRIATLGNAFDRAQLIRDPKRIVAIAVIKSPGVTEIEAAKYAGNTGLNEDVIAYIAAQREWTKLYQIKQALVNNPKCPLPAAMRLLPHLREKDLQAVSRSKGIPSALATQARKLLQARTSGK